MSYYRHNNDYRHSNGYSGSQAKVNGFSTGSESAIQLMFPS